MTNKNFIIINGRHYDASSGELISGEINKTKPKSLDGISGPRTSTQAKLTPKPKPLEGQPVRRAGHSHDVILASKVHGKTMPKPLMRVGVKKPSHDLRPRNKVQAPIKTKTAPARQTHTNVTTHSNDKRLQRAASISRSSHLNHFSKSFTTEVKRSPTSPSKTSPLSYGGIVESHSVGTNKLQEILDKGLQKASSHSQILSLQEKVRKRRKRSKIRRLNISVLVVAILLILGLVVYKNLPSIDVRIASTHAGMNGEVPGYIPPGFKFSSPVRWGQGMVTVVYTSPSGSFHVIQQVSGWDSISLKDSFVSSVDPSYKVVQAGGRIIYIFGQGNATWVNGGIWYQITDSANLSTTDLIKIATSL